MVKHIAQRQYDIGLDGASWPFLLNFYPWIEALEKLETIRLFRNALLKRPSPKVIRTYKTQLPPLGFGSARVVDDSCLDRSISSVALVNILALEVLDFRPNGCQGIFTFQGSQGRHEIVGPSLLAINVQAVLECAFARNVLDGECAEFGASRRDITVNVSQGFGLARRQ
jgi:hypothetical protein